MATSFGFQNGNSHPNSTSHHHPQTVFNNKTINQTSILYLIILSGKIQIYNFQKQKIRIIKQSLKNAFVFSYLCSCRIGSSCKHSRGCSFFFHFIHIRFLLRTESSKHFLAIIHCQTQRQFNHQQSKYRPFNCSTQIY